MCQKQSEIVESFQKNLVGFFGPNILSFIHECNSNDLSIKIGNTNLSHGLKKPCLRDLLLQEKHRNSKGLEKWYFQDRFFSLNISMGNSSVRKLFTGDLVFY